MSFNSISIANLFNSDDECYKAELARRRAEIEALFWQQEEKEQLECQAWKEAKIAEQKRLEEEVQRKEEKEELQQKEKKHQRNLAYHLKIDHVTTMEQQCWKNWENAFLLPSTPPSNKKMNLINLSPLTKR